MPRHSKYGRNDEAPIQLGDSGWRGVNMRLDPSQVPPGLASESINMRYTDGIPTTRKGYVKLTWTNKPFVEGDITSSAGTATFTATQDHGFLTGMSIHIYGCIQNPYNGVHVVTVTSPTVFTYAVGGGPASPATGFPAASNNNVYPWGEIHGMGVFNSPTTFVKYLLIAADGNVYYTFGNNHPRRIALPADTVLTGRVTFTQAFDKVVMFRGDDAAPLEMASVDLGFKSITPAPLLDFTQPIPNADRAVFFQNRLVIPHGDDEVALSDIGNYTRYEPTRNDFKINQGSADRLITVTKFNDTTLVCFKDHSIYAIYNVYGDDLSAVQQDELTSQFGLVAPDSVAHVGKDLWFLSELGVMSVTQTEQNKLQGVVLPASDPIDPLIKRINWRFARPGAHGPGAVAAYWDNKYYLAVPLDDAEILGAELIPSSFLNYIVTFTTPVVPGKTYRFTKGANNINLENGTDTYTTSQDFVAQGPAVTLNLILSPYTITGSIREVRKGVNTAVFVYDFLQQSWAGYDQSPGFDVKEWAIYEHQGARRLFAATSQGFLVLYEEATQDQLLVPYADFEFTKQTTTFDWRYTVNGGTTFLTIDELLNDPVIAPPVQGWGCNNIAVGIQNLYTDVTRQGGFFLYGLSYWEAPNTLVTPTATGVRIFATNGLVPECVVTAGTGSAPVTFTQSVVQPVISEFTTRAYLHPSQEINWESWLTLDVQTWDPAFRVELLTEGVNESSDVIPERTRDRAIYYRPFNAAPFVVTNSADNFLTPYRQDYSVALAATTAGGDAAAFDIDNGGSGVMLEQMQQVREVRKVNVAARACRIRVTNSTGRIRIMSAKLEGADMNVTAGTFA